MSTSKILITGGAGFIGSALCEALLAKGNEVVVFDNLSSGRMENLANCTGKSGFKFVKGDVLDEARLEKVLRSSRAQIVFHFGAEPDVRRGETDPGEIWRQNVEGTKAVLRACEAAGGVETIVFASTSTVYGNTRKIPTPEGEVLAPVSEYGKTKAEGEKLVAEFCKKNNRKGLVVRFANVIGQNSGHGVIFDFFKKLEKNPFELEVLGDGNQDKSYLYVGDAVSGVIAARDTGLGAKGETVAYNIGSRDSLKVRDLAEIVCRAAGKNAKLRFTGGNVGWKGDVPVMLLDCRKLEKLGWAARLGSRQAVEKTVLEFWQKKHK